MIGSEHSLEEQPPIQPSSEASIQVECWDREQAKAAIRELPLSVEGAVFRLAIPERVQYAAVRFQFGDRQLLVAIAPGDHGEIDVEVERISGKYRIEASNCAVYYLPKSFDSGKIAAPVHPASRKRQLDFVLLIDGTMRLPFVYEEGSSRSRLLLLTNPGCRDALFSCLFEAIGATLEAKTYSDIWGSVVAFGDLPMAGLLQSPDLMPSYVVYPADRRLERMARVETLRNWVASVPGSNGADFVDALGEGLYECSRLRWRPQARKVLILVGESPGFSLLHREPRQSDLRARERDVDLETSRLTAKGVEVVTIFSRLSHFRDDLPGLEKLFIEFARNQYARLASSREYFFEVEWNSPTKVSPAGQDLLPLKKDPAEELQALLVDPAADRWLGRGLCWAMFGDS